MSDADKRDTPEAGRGTPAGRLAAVSKYAQEHCGYDPVDAVGPETRIFEHIAQLETLMEVQLCQSCQLENRAVRAEHALYRWKRQARAYRSILRPDELALARGKRESRMQEFRYRRQLVELDEAFVLESSNHLRAIQAEQEAERERDRLRKEIEGVLATIPGAVRVRENGGLEDVAASLAVSVRSLQQKHDDLVDDNNRLRMFIAKLSWELDLPRVSHSAENEYVDAIRALKKSRDGARTPAEPSSSVDSFVDEHGVFHCQCGATHRRGPVDALASVWRCLKCGRSLIVSIRLAADKASVPSDDEGKKRT